ncbi:MAG: redoxin domain-containing protein [Gammaproteobacteria bacterium]|nr:redoxin domain-containing protein [Gammaproteobacteria bacterium]MDP2347870.1 redoxin domain-containing protein [Gammaproteobacteria bacterium]
MKLVVLVISFFLSISNVTAASVRGVSDFALLDHEGYFHQLSRYEESAAVVIYVYGNKCSVSAEALPKLNLLQSKYSDRNINFLMLDPFQEDSRQQVISTLAVVGSRIPVLMDRSQLVSQSLGVEAAGEVFVIDPRRMTLLYRGAIDSRIGSDGRPQSSANNRNYLEEVLSAISVSAPVIADAPWIHGDPVLYTVVKEAVVNGVSYVNDVVPILKRQCVSCHREGGVAPWSMDSHQMVSGWSSMIKETLLTMRMPPGQIDYEYLDKFVDVHHITDVEKAVLVSWVDEGAPRDGDVDPLLHQPAVESEWALGEPDLIVEFPAQEIPASGVLDYKFVPVEIGLDRDRWVRAYEFDIGDKATLHHIVAYTQDERQQRQNASGGGSRTNFGGYAPGRAYMSFDNDTGILLKRDMRLMIQFHYTTIGRPVVDVTKIGLYFHDTPPKYPLVRTAVMNGEFVVPPGVADFSVTATTKVTKDSYLYNIAPHMHYRGKRVKYRLEYPSGLTEELLSVPNFQHNWQMTYRLREPKFLPAGTVIVADGAFDNSSQNALNPDPSQEVRWGDQVWDEMFIAWLGISEIE